VSSRRGRSRLRSPCPSCEVSPRRPAHPGETLATLGGALSEAGVLLSFIYSRARGEPVPESAEELGGLIVPGDPMGPLRDGQLSEPSGRAVADTGRTEAQASHSGRLPVQPAPRARSGRRSRARGHEGAGLGRSKTMDDAFYEPLFSSRAGRERRLETNLRGMKKAPAAPRTRRGSSSPARVFYATSCSLETLRLCTSTAECSTSNCRSTSAAS
jgi:hypothetical protein